MLARRGPGPGSLRPVVSGGKTRWLASWRDADGHRHRRFLGSCGREAQRKLAAIIRQRDQEILGIVEGPAPVRFAEVCELYLVDLRARARPRTVHDAGVVLARAQRELDCRWARDVTKARVAGWRARLVAGGLAHKSANTAVGTLHAAFAHALAMGLVSVNPLAGMRALPVTPQYRRRLPRALSEHEIVRLLQAGEALDARSDHLPRSPLMRALIWTGARFSELVAARWADLDWDRPCLTLRGETTKTQRTRTIPLAPELVEVLSDYRRLQTAHAGREPRPDARIFVTPDGRPARPQYVVRFREWLLRALDEAGIPRVDSTGRVLHVHALRHTFATRLARHGIPVQTAMALTGHRSVELLLAVYTHLDAEDARAAIRALTPLGGRGSFRAV